MESLHVVSSGPTQKIYEMLELSECRYVTTYLQPHIGRSVPCDDVQGVAPFPN